MSVTVVVGAQWGDEGKGKIVDILSEKVDVVARYQGGPNAGHTVVIGDEQIILHQIPSGILRPHTICVIGSGVVIDPAVLMDEIEFIRSKNIKVNGRLLISHRAHLIMPYHKLLDSKREQQTIRKKIGTTGRGIGPAYGDKFNRTGIRIVDLLDRHTLKEKLQCNIDEKNMLFEHIYHDEKIDTENIIRDYIEFDQKIDDYVTDTTVYLNNAIHDGKEVLVEGAQGTMLDIDYGTYPYVTSSNPTAGGACTGLGISPLNIDRILGIVKAYTTRVGMGPLPSEFDKEFGDRVRELGGEYGATTGRPRRCGWFDAVVVKYAARINGLSHLAITKLDVLDTLPELKICTGYKYKNKIYENFPAELWILENLEPVYETCPGWLQDTSTARSFNDLPENARNYLNRISELVDVPISIVSVGSERNQTIMINTF